MKKQKNATGGALPENVTVQVIHQLIIPETPRDIIGEKVVYNKKFLKRVKNNPSIPLPECGYFTIIKAILEDDGRVMVKLHPNPPFSTGLDDTHICVGNMEKYKGSKGDNNE